MRRGIAAWFLLLVLVWAGRQTAFLGTPIRDTKPRPGPPQPDADVVLQRTTAGAYVALTYPFLPPDNSMATMKSFGNRYDTYTDIVTNPLLYPEGAAVFFILEAVLLWALSTPDLDASDRVRIGWAITLTSLASLAVFWLSITSGLSQDPAALVVVTVVGAATLAIGARVITGDSSRQEAVALLESDARDLVGGAGAGQGALVGFYRLSSLLSLLVGMSLLLSPVSPLAYLESGESPATHWMRQELGIYFSFILCPVQAALYRAAKLGKRGTSMIRALSMATGLIAGLLVLNGIGKVEQARTLAESLSPEEYGALMAMQDSQSVGRGVTNVEVVTIIGLVVPGVYVAAALV